MIDGDVFEKVANIACCLKKVHPFGGIQVWLFGYMKCVSHNTTLQLVVTGDFFQLPPVTKLGTPAKFAFEAASWNEAIQRSFNLTKVFRQQDQGAFSKLLF
jgi:ATP-dependent DNA helicase PIF1